MPLPTLPIPWPKPIDYTKQSYEVPGTRRPGQTGHYRSAVFPFATLERPDAFVNCVEFFDSGRKRVPGTANMLGRRPIISKNPLKFADHFEWLSWDTVDAKRRAIGSGLHKLFSDGVLAAGDLRIVGIYSPNSPNWQIVDLAAQAYELVSVSLYDTLGKDTVEYIINHTEMPILFAAVHHIPALLKLSSKVPSLKTIVAMDPLESEPKKILSAWGEQVGIKVMDIDEVEEFGKSVLRDIIYPKSDTVATICYTSGTTGNPKGVIMTHGVLANAVHAQLHGIDFDQTPVSIAFLPLAHCYGRCVALAVVASGGASGSWSGDPLRLLEDLQILKPNLFCAVPRVINRIYQAGMAATKLPGIKGALFRHALQVKLNNLKTTGSTTHPVWDRIVFKKIRDVLGGNVKQLSSGSAPMNPMTIDFLRIALDCEVNEGYGCTENVGVVTKTILGDSSSSGTVGPPQPNVEVKLVDVPSMGYHAEDKPHPRGEIYVRGDGCFPGYYKDPENTKAAIDEEGWQRTGDVGEIDSCGRFKIIDRVKNIMKLAQGEYVALERIEALYGASPVVAQIYVHGDSLQSYLVALVIPDPVQLAGIASKIWGTTVSPTDTVALDKAVRDAKVNEEILKHLGREAKANSLQGFETIKRIHLLNELFSIDNGCLTPTFKVKRKDVQKRYKKEIDYLYSLGEPTSAAKEAKL